MSSIVPGGGRPMAPRAAGGRPQGGAPAAGASIDPVRVLRQHIGGIIISTAVGAVLAAGFYVGSYFLYPLYDSQSVFEIRNRLLDPREVRTAEFNDEETVARLCTQEAARVVERRALMEAIEGKVAILDTTWIKAYPDDAGGTNWDDAVDDLEKEVRAGHLRGTQQFYVAWRSHKDDDVIAVLHALEEHYLSQKRQADRAEDEAKRVVFAASKAAIDAQIVEAQSAIVSLIGDQKLDTFDESEQQALKTLEDIERRMNETAQSTQMLQGRLSVAEGKLGAGVGWSEDDRANVQRNPVLMDLRTQLVTYKTQLTAALERFGPDHFRLDELKRLESAAEEQYNALETRLLREEVAGEKALTTYQLQGLELVLNDLKAKQTDERTRLNAAAKAVSQLKEIRDRKERLEEESKDLQSQIVGIDLVLARPDAETVRLVGSALKPRELWFPKLKIVVPGVTLLVIALYVAWIFFREMTDKRVRFPADLASMPGAARLLGVIPDAQGDPSAPEDLARAATSAPNSYLAESYRQTFGLLARQLRGREHVIIAFVSPTPEAGVSTCACNLALIARSIGLRVLLVEANFRRPGLASMLDVATDAVGLGDAINGGQPASSCIQSLPDGFDLLAAGSPGSRGVERLYTPIFREAMESLRAQYDLILLDCPPTIVAGEATTLAQAADSTILVAHAYTVDKGLVQKTVSVLGDLGNEFLGAILFANRTTAGGYQRKNLKLLQNYTDSGTDAEPEAANA